MRFDAEASALMAGAYTQESADLLENRLGRATSEGELYIAHFLGAGGAAKLISAAEDTPNARADTLFPAAAAANKSIFMTVRTGAQRCRVYANLIGKHENTDATRFAEAAENRLLSPNSQKSVTKRAEGHFEAPAGRARTGYATRGASLPSPSYPANAGTSGTSRYGATLHLTPAVVEILASLDPIPQGRDSLRTSDRSDERRDEARAEERRERARLLPRSGFAYG